MARFDTGRLYATLDGFNWDSGEVFTWIMHYDKNGNYVGQTQMDVQGDGNLYLSAEMINGQPCVNGKPVEPLSDEDMRRAEQHKGEVGL